MDIKQQISGKGLVFMKFYKIGKNLALPVLAYGIG